MNMDSGGNFKKVLRSFSYALQGIFHVLKTRTKYENPFCSISICHFNGVYFFAVNNRVAFYHGGHWRRNLVGIGKFCGGKGCRSCNKGISSSGQTGKRHRSRSRFCLCNLSVLIGLFIFLPKIAEFNSFRVIKLGCFSETANIQS